MVFLNSGVAQSPIRKLRERKTSKSTVYVPLLLKFLRWIWSDTCHHLEDFMYHHILMRTSKSNKIDGKNGRLEMYQGLEPTLLLINLNDGDKWCCNKALSCKASRSTDFEDARFHILPKITLFIRFWDKTSKIYGFKRFLYNLKIHCFFELHWLILAQNPRIWRSYCS